MAQTPAACALRRRNAGAWLAVSQLRGGGAQKKEMRERVIGFTAAPVRRGISSHRQALRCIRVRAGGPRRESAPAEGGVVPAAVEGARAPVVPPRHPRLQGVALPARLDGEAALVQNDGGRGALGIVRITSLIM